MKTRMQKYYDQDTNTLSRSSKNKELYKEVSTTDIESFDLNSNVSILGDNSKNINLSRVQQMLNEKYKEEPRKKTSMAAEREPQTELDLDETREYDINTILNKAKENKEVDYEVDRLKKLRNTQYDILNNLDLEPKDDNELDDITMEQAKLMDLINTITSKELANDIKKEQENTDEEETTGELDPLDILTDLRGDNENTTTLGAIQEEVLKRTQENEIIEPIAAPDVEEKEKKNEDTIELKEEKEEVKTKEFEMEGTSEVAVQPKPLEPTSENIFNTTSSIQFSQSDFDDFNDLKDDMKAAKIIIKILIVLIIAAFIVGCVFLINNIFDLGLI